MQDWEKLVVKPDLTLFEVVKILNEGGQGIVLVADENRFLQGTVTDGDIRRALINIISMDSPVAKVMCKTPKKAYADWSKERILATMDTYSLLQMPIINEKGQIIGLQTIHELLKNRQRENPVYLMAGGFGKRLYPLTQECPKPLIKIGDKPILELILERLVSQGFHRFYISLHYMADMIKDHFGDGRQWGVDIEYIFEETPLGTGGALGLLPHNEIDSPLILMNADLLTNLNMDNLLLFHAEHQGIATMCVREYEYSVPFGVVNSQGYKVESIVEKPVYKFFVNAGIYLLSPNFVKSVAPNIPIDITTLLELKIATGHRVNLFPIHEYWRDIGRLDDLKCAQNDFKEYLL